MKKIFSLFLAVLLVIGLLPMQSVTALAADPAFTLDVTANAHTVTTLEADDIVTVKVIMPAVSEVCGIQFDMDYDAEKLTYNSDADISGISSKLPTSVASTPETGKIRVTGAATANQSFDAETVALKASFTVKANTSGAASFALSGVTVQKIVEYIPASIPWGESSSFSVTITAPAPTGTPVFNVYAGDGVEYATTTDDISKISGETLKLKVVQTGGETVDPDYLWKTATSADGTLTATKKTAVKYTVPTSAVGETWYACEVTYTPEGGEATTITTKRIKVSVDITQEKLDSIAGFDEQPIGGEWIYGDSGDGVEDFGAILQAKPGNMYTENSLKWFVSNDGGSSWTEASDYGSKPQMQSSPDREFLVLYTLPAGTYKFKSTADYSVKNLAGETLTATATSNIVDVTIESTEWDGEGTKASPYLIATQTDIIELSNKSKINNFSGKFFKFTSDITLPTGWTPIGTTDKRFAGTIDGDNHLLTIPEGEKALIGAPSQATLKNLDIYGTKINGNGVVAIYATGALGTAITIENVTLKSGTQTLYSGFVGGYASGSYPAVIRNCTVESGVIIGYDGTKSNIGSFGGDINGTIVGCVSHATVKGVNFVGGISGSKGQTMGDYIIIDCVFDGEVIATGNNVGGISGSGYAGTSFGLGSAPNTPCATIKNCFVSGSVSGANNVGGILGSEPGVKECWNNGVGYIQNNLFTGTLTATGEYKGAIIGYMSSINNMNVITGNYYLNTSADKGIGGAEMVETPETSGSIVSGPYTFTFSGKKWGRTDDPLGTDADKLAKAVTPTELSDGTVLGLLNSGAGSSKNWVSGTTPTINLSAGKHLIRITCSTLSTSGGVSQEAFGTDILSGKTLTLHYSDGTTGTVPATDATKGYTITKELIGKYIPAAINYQGQQLVFNLGINNTTPAISEGLGTAAAKTVAIGKNYSLDLKTVFEDKDGDTLTFTYNVDSEKDYSPVDSANGIFTYNPTAVGTTVFRFKATDGVKTTSAYMVTLTVVGLGDASLDTLSGLSGNAVLNSLAAGTIYYKALGVGEAAPTAAQVKESGTRLDVISGNNSIPVTFSKTSEQKLYVVYDGSDDVLSANIAKAIQVEIAIHDYTAVDAKNENKISETGIVLDYTSVSVPDGSTIKDALERLFANKTELGGVIVNGDFGNKISEIGTLEGSWMVGYTPNGGVFDDFSNSGIDNVTLSDGDKISVDWSETSGYQVEGDYDTFWTDTGSFWGGIPLIESFKIDGYTGIINTENKAGTEESPYEILVRANSVSGKAAAITTNLNSHYRVLSVDVTAAQDYNLAFYLSNLGGSAKTYYKVIVDAVAPFAGISFLQTANETAKGTVTVTASDENGIASVKLTGPDSYSETKTAAPYSFNVTKAGEYSADITDCAGNTTDKPITVSFIGVESITISAEKTSTELDDGVLNMSTGSFDLKAVIAPEGATEIFTASWSSNMPSVATVDQNGKVTAVGTGLAMISASAGGKSATVLVEVVKPGEKTVNDAANLEDIAEGILPEDVPESLSSSQKAQLEAVTEAVQKMSDSEKDKLSDEIIEKLDELAKAAGYNNLTINIEATATDTVPEADRVKPEGSSAVGLISAVGTNDLAGKEITLKVSQKAAESGMKYTFELELDLNGAEKELASPVIITLKMPENYVHDSSYQVKHILDNGSVEWLPITYDSQANTITFRTGSFSDFSIGSKPVNISTGSGIVHIISSANGQDEENPNTGYDAPLSLVISAAMLLAAAAISSGKIRR